MSLTIRIFVLEIFRATVGCYERFCVDYERIPVTIGAKDMAIGEPLSSIGGSLS